MFHGGWLPLAMGILVTACGGKSDAGSTASGGTAGSSGGGGGAGTGNAGGGSGDPGSGNVGGGSGGGSGTGNAGGAAGATPAYDACADPSECTFVPAGCCSACAPQTADFVALNRASVDDYLASQSCAGAICPHCASTTNAWFGLTCDSGHCKVFDARETDLTVCQKSSDCRLRAGLACCESCSASEFDVVAINASADLRSLVCDPDTACDACAPVYPSTFTATCVSGRCQTMSPLR
jgi:hypothetical protein